MARVIAIHTWQLNPGVGEGAFERFMKETFAPLYHQYGPTRPRTS